MDGPSRTDSRLAYFPAAKRWITTPGEPAGTPSPQAVGTQPLGCSMLPVMLREGVRRGVEAGLAVFCGTSQRPPKLTPSSEHVSK